MSDQGNTVTSEQKKEDWMNAKWRPMMGWMYMLVCTMDFVVFPILWSLVQAYTHGSVGTQWSPVTLQGAGLFHMAMGAVIGVAAFGRTQEKLAGASTASTTVSTPAPAPAVSSGFGSVPLGNGSGTFASSSFPSTPAGPYIPPAPAPVVAPVFVSSSGKPGPAPQADLPI
jgi:hypothetical protein